MPLCDDVDPEGCDMAIKDSKVSWGTHVLCICVNGVACYNLLVQEDHPENAPAGVSDDAESNLPESMCLETAGASV